MPRSPEPGEMRSIEAVKEAWRAKGYEQLSIFDDHAPVSPPPSQAHSPTSVAAAHQIESVAHSLRSEIYRYLLNCGLDGSTDEEGQAALNIVGNTYRPRRVELQEMGLVLDSKRTRLTTSRRAAVVWTVHTDGLRGS